MKTIKENIKIYGSINKKAIKGSLKILIPLFATYIFMALSVFMMLLPHHEEILFNHKKETTRQLTEHVLSLLNGFETKVASGDITPEKARKEAADQIRHLRYGTKGRNYFWINDMHPIMIMHPYRLDLEGKDLTHIKNSDGTHIFISIIQKVMNDKEGFVNYNWQFEANGGVPIPKISFVKEFSPWEWVVGTGINVEDIDQEVHAATKQFIYFFSILLAFVVLISMYITRQIFRMEHKKNIAEESKELETLRLKKLFELSHLSEEPLNTITDFALEETVTMTCSKIGYLAFVEEDESVLRMHAWSRNAMKECSIEDKKLEYQIKDSGIWAETARTGKAVIINDYENFNPTMKNGLPKGHLPICRLLSIPVFEGKKIVAIAGVGNKESDYKDSDVQQLQQMMEGMWHILKKKKTENELRESEEMYRLLFDGAQIMISVYDKDGKCILMNNRLANLFGGKPREFIGKTLQELHPIMGEKFHQRIHEVMESKEIRDYEDMIEFPNDEKKNFTTSVLPVKNSKGKIHAAKIISQDITEKSKLKEQLLRARKMEAIGTLAGGIAHDFNNILSSILAFTELARLRVKDDLNLKDDLDQVLAAGIRARDLVKHILTFSKKADTHKDIMPITPLVKESLKFLRASIPSNIEIKTEFTNETDTVFADPTQLHQVFMNLFTNAIYAMKENGGTLEVTLGTTDINLNDTRVAETLKPGKYLEMTVSDTGTGIATHLMDKIFEPFFTTKVRGEGTGMGLSIVYGIVKEMHGHISVANETHNGTIFNILLPTIMRNELSPIDLEDNFLINGKGNILLVDDEPSIIEFTSEMLKGFGYSVESFTSSTRALKRFELNPGGFDVVLTDLKMPEMTGFELSTQIRSKRADIPVILFTGFSEGLTAENVKKYGVSQILVKPIIASELSKKIKLALQQNQD